MLTTVSEELFEEACQGIVEGSSQSGFDWDDMLKNASTIKTVNNYMKHCNCKELGNGSGRQAWLVKEGSKASDGVEIKGPACFKVAKNMKGVAQNLAEAEYLEKLKSYSFAPIIYNHDPNGLFILVEAGTPIKGPRNKKLMEYFREWNDWAWENGFTDEDDEDFTLYNGTNNDFFDGFMFHVCGTADFDAKGVDTILDGLKRMSSEIPKYKPIYELCDFLFGKNAVHNLEAYDFCQYANWAFVKRNRESVIIPIDFGFTKEVREKYYL